MAEFDPEKARFDFLLEMYKQMMNDINRHIVVVWQSVSVLVGAFAVWSLVEKKTISIDVAATLIVLIAAWVIAHVYDAAYWYNRNLVIIANIERQFLRVSDLREVHYYFGAHRGKGTMLTHLRLQRMLAVGVAGLVLGIHFFQVIVPGLRDGGGELQGALPWLAAVCGVAVWLHADNRATTRYQEFLENSPGKVIDAAGVRYGEGHPLE